MCTTAHLTHHHSTPHTSPQHTSHITTAHLTHHHSTPDLLRVTSEHLNTYKTPQLAFSHLYLVPWLKAKLSSPTFEHNSLSTLCTGRVLDLTTWTESLNPLIQDPNFLLRQRPLQNSLMQEVTTPTTNNSVPTYLLDAFDLHVVHCLWSPVPSHMVTRHGDQSQPTPLTLDQWTPLDSHSQP